MGETGDTGRPLAELRNVWEKAWVELIIAASSAFKGSVDFGPEVTSSDKSLKVLLNAEDKVRVWVCQGIYSGPLLHKAGVQPLGRRPQPWEVYPHQLGSDPSQHGGSHL